MIGHCHCSLLLKALLRRRCELMSLLRHHRLQIEAEHGRLAAEYSSAREIMERKITITVLKIDAFAREPDVVNDDDSRGAELLTIDDEVRGLSSRVRVAARLTPEVVHDNEGFATGGACGDVEFPNSTQELVEFANNTPGFEVGRVIVTVTFTLCAPRQHRSLVTELTVTVPMNVTVTVSCLLVRFEVAVRYFAKDGTALPAARGSPSSLALAVHEPPEASAIASLRLPLSLITRPLDDPTELVWRFKNDTDGQRAWTVRFRCVATYERRLVRLPGGDEHEVGATPGSAEGIKLLSEAELVSSCLKIALDGGVGGDGTPRGVLRAPPRESHKAVLDVLLALPDAARLAHAADRKTGRTALHVAAKHNNVETVRALVRWPGCRIDLQDADRRSAIDIANDEGFTELAELLKVELQFAHEPLFICFEGDGDLDVRTPTPYHRRLMHGGKQRSFSLPHIYDVFCLVFIVLSVLRSGSPLVQICGHATATAGRRSRRCAASSSVDTATAVETAVETTVSEDAEARCRHSRQSQSKSKQPRRCAASRC